MAVVSWSQCGGLDCLRISGVPIDADIRVHTQSAALAGGLPPMAGTFVAQDDAICFVPRFPFVGSTEYTVLVDGVAAVVVVRPSADPPATTTVVEIFPTAHEVPRNLLRFYVRFSAPMSEGCAARSIRLVDDDGDELPGALLPSDDELWDRDRRRLTVLLDPGADQAWPAPPSPSRLPAHRREICPASVVDPGFRMHPVPRCASAPSGAMSSPMTNGAASTRPTGRS